MSNDTGFLVENYSKLKLLSKLGYRFDPNELEQFEVEAYNVINSKISELIDKEHKKKKRKR